MSTSTQPGGPEMTSTATTSAVPTHSALPQGAAPVQVPLSTGHIAEGSGNVHGIVSAGDPLSASSVKAGTGLIDGSKRDEGAITPPIPKVRGCCQPIENCGAIGSRCPCFWSYGRRRSALSRREIGNGSVPLWCLYREESRIRQHMRNGPRQSRCCSSISNISS